jgi:hypothetical protein
MKRRFLFLLAWASGSDGEADNLAPGEYTRVEKQEDLLIQFEKKNKNIFALEIWASNENIAAALGYKEAFMDNYTAHDSVSSCEEILTTEVLTLTTIICTDSEVVTTHYQG